MTCLLDTHSFILTVEADSRLGNKAAIAIQDTRNEILVSVASLWELAIKVSVGKLSMTTSFGDLVSASARAGIDLIEIVPESLPLLLTMPFHHKDPFDRLLAATALHRGVTLISSDSVFDQYGVKRVW